MNIIVRNFGAELCNFRPDTTRDRLNEDLYPQESIVRLAYAPVLFARICKAGRSVKANFAQRYFDAVNFGVLLYDEDRLESGSLTGYAEASCIDHTSFLPFPMYDKITLGHPGNRFELFADGEKLFSHEADGSGLVEDSIEKATSRIHVRTGDLICCELAPISHLMSREDGSRHIRASYCGNTLLDFDIIM